MRKSVGPSGTPALQALRALLFTWPLLISCGLRAVSQEIDIVNSGHRDIWVTRLDYGETNAAPGYLKAKTLAGHADIFEPIPDHLSLEWRYVGEPKGVVTRRLIDLRPLKPRTAIKDSTLKLRVEINGDEVTVEFRPAGQ